MNLFHVQRMLEREPSKDKLIQLIQQNRDRYDSILENVPRKFKDDLDVVVAATIVDVRNIRYASERIRNMEGLAIELVQRKWEALQYLGDEARRNRRVVVAAIRKNGMAIQYAMSELWDDVEIMADAIQQNPAVMDWLDSLEY